LFEKYLWIVGDSTVMTMLPEDRVKSTGKTAFGLAKLTASWLSVLYTVADSAENIQTLNRRLSSPQ
jgi:hypothetical protein